MDICIEDIPAEYKVAVIQNQSELNQYSYADVFPFISKLYPNSHSFTSADIEDLLRSFEVLSKFDAIVLGSNACNDRIVLETLNKYSKHIEEFLQQGKGLLVLFQKKLQFEEVGFVPSEARFSFKDRGREESVLQGKIEKNEEVIDSPLLKFPHLIDPKKVQNQLKGGNLQGLYWRFLDKFSLFRYEVLLVDESSKPARPLLISTRMDLPYRIVVSALMLDWQKQFNLLENVLRYVVEGPTRIAVITNNKFTPFHFNYFLKTLSMQHISYYVYPQDELNFRQIPFDVHDTIILDPGWTTGAEDKIHIPWFDLDKARARVIYFEPTPNGRTLIAKSMSGGQTFDLLIKAIRAWLYTRFDEKQGTWDGSFLRTAFVLRSLLMMDESKPPIPENYSKRILENIKSHDKDGSYDNVFGATCELLRVYSELLGQNDQRTQQTIEWIKKEIDAQDLPEQLLALGVLTEVLGKREVKSLASQILPKARAQLYENPHNSSLFLSRALDFFREFGNKKDVDQIIRQLGPLQDKRTGLWDKNHQRTAAITISLLAVRDTSKTVEEMIFNSILYFRDYINEFERKRRRKRESREHNHEKDDFYKASDVAAAIWALYQFESEINFPVEELLYSLGSVSVLWRPSVRGSDFASYVYDIISANADLRQRSENQVRKLHDLESELEKKSEKISALESKYDSLRKRFKIAGGLTLFFLTGALIFGFFFLKALSPETTFVEFIRNWSDSFATVGALIMSFYVMLLVFFEYISRDALISLKQMFQLSESSSKDGNRE